jgi:hypothetical protein
VEPLPTLEAPVNVARRVAALFALAVLLGAALAMGPGVAAAALPAHVTTAASSALTGSVSGPTVLGLNGRASYTINATGGPAYAPNGTQVGNVTFYASLQASNTTGMNFTPSQFKITNGTFPGGRLSVNDLVQLVTILVMISSTNATANDTINVTYSVHVVQPYSVTATIVDRSNATVLAFVVYVALDGATVGNVSVPSLTPGASYALAYQYVTLGLGTGWHTFTISLANEHGLVAFANGALTYSATFYIPGAATDYTLWYVAGVVAFFGVLFIYATRVAARRRGALRK